MKDSVFKDSPYLMDGGLETSMIYREGIELNHFAAFELLLSEHGRQKLKEYYVNYLGIAQEFKLNFILEAPTWRANTDWGLKLGYSMSRISEINREAIVLMREIACDQQHPVQKLLISGCIGPRGDGYNPEFVMSPLQAKEYHSLQMLSFALADADLVSALTLTNSNEAIGIAMAAKEVHLPVVISFTVETDGRLPGGESLETAIHRVDNATMVYPEHYMINCAHPEHFRKLLLEDKFWRERIRGIRANASLKSHAELDGSDQLDDGDICELADAYSKLQDNLPGLLVYGGCCGTDHRHMRAICQRLF